jgi:hypothetical protein
MKIIDSTPFYDTEKSEISLVNRSKALMKYGSLWLKEVEGQKPIIAVLGAVLDRNYTLLRNVTPPGLETSFPLILVGPPGVYLLYVTALTGMYRVKGDQWGTISGNSFKPEKPNLMTRAERMARAIQLLLRRQGCSELLTVEPVLLGSDLSFNIDCIRPIIRIIMRDALEHFAVSLTQSRVVLTPEAVQDIVRHLTILPKTVQAQPVEILAAANPQHLSQTPTKAEVPFVSVFSSSEAMPPPLWSEEPTPAPAGITEIAVTGKSIEMEKGVDVEEGAEVEEKPASRFSALKLLNKKQLFFLISLFIFWCLLITVFILLVLRDQGIFA